MADYVGDTFSGKKIRCAINGFGRVGRIVARIAFKSDVLECGPPPRSLATLDACRSLLPSSR
jgi:hypothetical protein